MKDTVLLKRYDEGGNPYYRMTRVNAYKHYLEMNKPLMDFLRMSGYPLYTAKDFR